jgi:hypothetical protein
MSETPGIKAMWDDYREAVRLLAKYSAGNPTLAGRAQAALDERGRLQKRVDELLTERSRAATLVGRIDLGEVVGHVGTGESHYEAHIQCDEWAELETMFRLEPKGA